MRPRRAGPAAACLALAWLLGGCADGDVVHVPVPGGATCQGPPDDRWVVASPACGDRVQRGGVWVAGDEAYVVGGAGLVLRWDGARWRHEGGATPRELLAAAADGGIVWAAGAGGTLLVREAGAWRPLATGVAADLRRLAVAGPVCWALGGDATLVEARDGRADAVVPPPVPAALRDLCAAGDSLWVAAGTAGLHARAAGAWAPVAAPRLGGKEVRSVARLGDGRLVALADSLFVRDADRWRPLPVAMPQIAAQFAAIDRVRARGGSLWLDGPGAMSYRLHRDGAVWLVSVSLAGFRVAPLDGERWLAYSGDRLRWYGGEGGTREDPAGADHGWRVVALGDGTCAAYAYGSDPVGVDRDGVWTLATLEPEARSLMGLPLHGRAIDDFHVLHYRGLYHVRDGRATLVDEDITRGDALVARPDGSLLIQQSSRIVATYAAGVLDTLDLGGGEDTGLLRMGGVRPDGAAVVSGRERIWVVAGSGWTSLEHGLDDWLLAGFLPDGRVVAVPGDGPYIIGKDGSATSWLVLVWDPATGDARTVGTPLPTGCPDLQTLGARTHATGFYVWTSGASLVFRLAGDPDLHDWELVAGPLDREIVDLAVQPDGSLAAVADDRVTWHPGAGP